MTCLPWLYNEVGLKSLVESTRDAKLLCLQRFVRLFAYGGGALILALHLKALGNSEDYIGLFMTLTLVGDVIISMFLTLFADKLGRRRTMLLGASLMAISGVVFALTTNYWILLVAAILGVISPSGTEIGPFRAIEESTLAQITPPEYRTNLFAWYTMIGFAGAALGTLICGWVIARLEHLGWTDVDAECFIFLAYAGLGLLKLALIVLLSSATEQGRDSTSGSSKGIDDDDSVIENDADDPRQSLLRARSGVSPPSSPGIRHVANANLDTRPQSLSSTSTSVAATSTPAAQRWRQLIPPISPQTLPTILKLSALFALDAFGSGLVPMSLISLFFSTYHHLPTGPLGTFFSITSAIAALSNLFSASLARRLGLVQSMVLTHLPSSIFLALLPIPDNKHTWLAMTFQALRACSSTMDAAPRQAFLSSVVKEEERTAVMGWFNMVKTLAQSAGPGSAGALMSRGKVVWVFVIAGGLKAAYDLGIAVEFWRFGRARRDLEGRERGEGEL